MQDEILKHTEKIYKSASNSKHTFGEKAKEIIIEILIIVFAVTLSIWFHGWSEHRHQQKEVAEFLEDLKVDLKSDITDLEDQNSYLKNTVKTCNTYKNLQKSKIDSILKLKSENRISLSPISKIRNTGNYEGFKSSGKIGFIENRQLKIQILNYYQSTVPEKDESQIFYNSLIFELARELNSTSYENAVRSIYSSEKVKGFLDKLESQATQIIEVNKNVVKNAKEMLTEIDKATKQ